MIFLCVKYKKYKYTNTKYTSTAYDEVPERPSMWFVFENRFVQGYKKLFSYLSDVLDLVEFCTGPQWFTISNENHVKGNDPDIATGCHDSCGEIFPYNTQELYMHMSCDLGCFVENMFCTNLHGEKFSQ